jgi:hypothetical protein
VNEHRTHLDELFEDSALLEVSSLLLEIRRQVDLLRLGDVRFIVVGFVLVLVGLLLLFEKRQQLFLEHVEFLAALSDRSSEYDGPLDLLVVGHSMFVFP